MADVRGDISLHDPSSWPDADLFHAGFPCQSFSTAGHRRGTRDPRGKVIYAILDLIEVKLFRAVLLENVKGIMDPKFKHLLKWVVKQLQALGYVVHYKVLNARYHGVPQNRERFFLVAALRTAISHEAVFKWPRDLAEVPLESILDPLTEEELRTYLGQKRPPQANARQQVDEAYTAMESYGISPVTKNMVVDCDGSKFHMMFNISPCLTRTRAAGGGHWVTSRGRRFTTGEMERVQGISNLTRPESVSLRAWHSMLGNSIPVPLLQRVLAELCNWAGLQPNRVEDPYFSG